MDKPFLPTSQALKRCPKERDIDFEDKMLEQLSIMAMMGCGMFRAKRNFFRIITKNFNRVQRVFFKVREKRPICATEEELDYMFRKEKKKEIIERKYFLGCRIVNIKFWHRLSMFLLGFYVFCNTMFNNFCSAVKGAATAVGTVINPTDPVVQEAAMTLGGSET